MFRPLICWFTTLAALAHAATTNTFRFIGVVEPANLIVNGGFEEGREGPTGWRFGSARMENFQYGRTRDAAGGKLAARIVCRSDEMSGYWSQRVTVKPHTRYRLSLKVKLESGKALVYLRGKTLNQRLYLNAATDNPLVPVFLPAKWAAGVVETNTWLAQTLEFNSGDETSLALDLGMYFAAGAVNFDEVELREIP
ncbi:MAG: carbohydrate binding domain-containing protein [Verrucomicrobiae bacterium]|nr:carbohydrate binding domain-containing protein [Verrucomicrobiae bacterium]